MQVEALVCERCGAPVSFLHDGVCVRCAESVEPPMTKWMVVVRRLVGLRESEAR